LDLNALSAAAILDGLGTRYVGLNVVYWPELGSTNDEAKRLAGEGAPEGTLVIADYQTRGRGRLDRGWVAPRGSSLLMSIVFRPQLAPHQIQRLTMSCGLAVADAIEQRTGLRAGLKWPNDVVIAGAKAGGILTETEFRDTEIEFVVVGMGLNVNFDPALLPADMPAVATSLSHELGTAVPRLPLLWAVLEKIEERYVALRAGHSPHREWAARLVTLGKPVTVAGTGPVIEGVAESVDADGALLVRLPDGLLQRVLVGDVTTRSQGRPTLS
jgi:BirA family biotin operon repressor/biotin-[acetyl-CoA-carboxylase] ligase